MSDEPIDNNLPKNYNVEVNAPKDNSEFIAGLSPDLPQMESFPAKPEENVDASNPDIKEKGKKKVIKKKKPIEKDSNKDDVPRSPDTIDEIKDVPLTENQPAEVIKEGRKLKLEKIERKEIKPTKLKIQEKKEETPLFAQIKLRKASITPRRASQATAVPKVLLKSLIKRIDFPPEEQRALITEVNAPELDNGVLSRNYKEALKVQKKKVVKVKLPKIEKPELEKYIPFQVEKDEKTDKLPEEIERLPTEIIKEDKKEEEPIKIMLGKGELPEKKDESELVKLKKVTPEITKPEEESPESNQKLQPLPDFNKPVDEETGFTLEPLKNLETDFPSSAMDERPDRSSPESKDNLPEDITVKPRPKKEKPKETKDKKELILGKPKSKEADKPDDISLKKKQGELPTEPKEDITLKPFIKEKPDVDEVPKEINAGKPKPEDITRQAEELDKPEYNLELKPKKKIVKKVKKTSPEKDENKKADDLVTESVPETVKDSAQTEVKKVIPSKVPDEEAKPSKPEKIKEPESPEISKVKLRKPSIKPRKEEEQPKERKFLLKSLIKRIPYPPEEQHTKVTELPKVSIDNGVLSRNYKEAMKIQKPKSKKVKLSEKEDTDLEKYVPGEFEPRRKDSDVLEVVSKLPKRKVPEEISDQPIEITLGKGEIPSEEIPMEDVTLKPIPKKELEDIVKEEDETPKEEKSKPSSKTKPDSDTELLPFSPIKVEDSGRDKESPEKFERLGKEKPTKPKDKSPKEKAEIKEIPDSKIHEKSPVMETKTLPDEILPEKNSEVEKPVEEDNLIMKIVMKKKPEKELEDEHSEAVPEDAETSKEKPYESVTKKKSKKPIAEVVKKLPKEVGDDITETNKHESEKPTEETEDEEVQFAKKPVIEEVPEIEIMKEVPKDSTNQVLDIQDVKPATEESIDEVIFEKETPKEDKIGEITSDENVVKKKKPKKSLAEEGTVGEKLPTKQTVPEEVLDKVEKPEDKPKDEKPEEVNLDVIIGKKSKTKIPAKKEVPEKQEPLKEENPDEFSTDEIVIKKKKVKKPITEEAPETVTLIKETFKDEKAEEVLLDIKKSKEPVPDDAVNDFTIRTEVPESEEKSKHITTDETVIKEEKPKKQSIDETPEEVMSTKEIPHKEKVEAIASGEDVPQEKKPSDFLPEEIPETEKKPELAISQEVPKLEDIEEVTSEEVVLKKMKPIKPVGDEVVDEVTVKKEIPTEDKPEQVITDKVVVLKKKKPKKPDAEESPEVVTISKEEPKQEKVQEETSEKVVLKKKPIKLEADEVVDEVTIKKEVPREEEKPKEVIDSEVVVIKKRKPKKPVAEETPEVVTIAKEVPKKETAEEVVLKKKKPLEPVADEAVAELTIQKEVPEEEKPEDVVIDEVVTKKTKPTEPYAEKASEIVTLVKEVPKQEKVEEVTSEEVILKKKKPSKPVFDEAVGEVTIKKEASEELPEATDVDEIVAQKTKTPISQEGPEDVKISDVVPETAEEEPSQEVVVMKKKSKKPVTKEADNEVFITEKIPQGDKKPEDVTAEEVVVKKKKPIKPSEEVSAEVTISKKIPTEVKGEEVTADEVVLHKKKPKKIISEEAADEITIKKEVPEEIIEETKPYEETKPEEETKPDEVVVKKKKPKKSLKEKVPEETIKKEVLKDQNIEEKIVLKKKRPDQPDEAIDEVTIKKELPYDEEKPEDVTTDEIIIKQKKPKKPTSEEAPAEVTFTKEIPREENVEDVTTEEVVLQKKKPKKAETEEAVDEITIKKVVPKVEEDEVHEVTFVPRKTKKKEDVEQEFKIQLKDYEEEEVTLSGKVRLSRKPKPIVTEEAADEITIIKEVQEEEVEEIPEEIVTEEHKIMPKEQAAPKEGKPIEEETPEMIVHKKKPKKPEAEEVDITIEIPKDKEKTEEVTSDETVLKKKRPKKKAEKPEEVEITVTKIIPEPDDKAEEVEEVVKKKKQKSPVSDEGADEITIKKEVPQEEGEIPENVVMRRKPKLVGTDEVPEQFTVKKEIPKEQEQDDVSVKEVIIQKKKPKEQKTDEGTDEITVKKIAPVIEKEEEEEEVQSVTFVPRKTKKTEDVEQEFKIQMKDYEEEEVSLSGKVKLPKKPKPQVHSEEASAELTIQKEIEGPEDVKIPLRRKSSVSQYNVEDIEESFQVGLKQPRKQSIVYEEESLDLKVKRRPSKPIVPTFHQEEASLSITREEEVISEREEISMESHEGDILYSISSYEAENEDALSLVEGEKVYVIESTSQDWWFVRKHLTEERGWVPAIYLRDEPSYTLYVQKKLHEKIDKLPIFEKPGPGDEVYAPRFVEKLQPKHAPDGATIQFECQVEGNPRPQITWFRQTAIIKPSPDFQIYYDDDNVATLIIREVFPEDAGTFTCVAKNAAGFASSTTELTVDAPLSDHGSDATGLSRKSLSRESSLADILEGIPPTFSRKPKARVVPEGTDVELECRLVAVPEPEITWLYNGKEVEPSDSITVTTQSDMHMYCSILSIKRTVKKVHEGTYTIIAKNREGQATMDIILKVKTGEPEPPQVLEPLHDITISEGDSAVLSTQITGNPTPTVTWLKNGKPAPNLKTSSQDDIYTLTLIKPSLEDSARYTAVAKNKCGTAETSSILTVEGINQYLQHFNERKLMVGEGLEVIKEQDELEINKDINRVSSDMGLVELTASSKLDSTKVDTTEISEHFLSQEQRSFESSFTVSKMTQDSSSFEVSSMISSDSETLVEKKEVSSSIESFESVRSQVLKTDVFHIAVEEMKEKSSVEIQSSDTLQTELEEPIKEVIIGKTTKVDKSAEILELIEKQEEFHVEDKSKITESKDVEKFITEFDVPSEPKVEQSTYSISEEEPRVVVIPRRSSIKTNDSKRRYSIIDESPVEMIIQQKPSTSKADSIKPPGITEEKRLEVVIKHKDSIPVGIVKEEGEDVFAEGVIETAPKPTHDVKEPSEQMQVTGSLKLPTKHEPRELKSESASAELSIQVKEEVEESVAEEISEDLNQQLIAKMKLTGCEIVRQGDSPSSKEIPGPQAPLFVERFEEQTIKEKGTIKLVAKVVGNPIPTVTWFRNNKTLLASPRNKEFFDGENIILEIIDADSEVDAGDYKCVASNSVGTATHGARITVDVEKVSFTKLLEETIEVNETQTVTLECETSHTVSTKWQHNGKELSGMDHREVVQEGRTHRLVIKRANPLDAGSYTCSVKDQITASTLVVHEMKPDFTKRLEDIEVKELESAILEVEVTSEAAEVTWHKDGEQLSPSKEKLTMEKRGNIRKLLIRSISVHDEGEYTCSLGDQECTGEVTVIELPPRIKTKLQDVTVTQGEKATLEIELTKGDAMVRWFKNNKEIQFSEHVQLSIDGKRQKLKIYQAKLSDAGIYKCQVGDQTSEARVTVEEPAVEFITKLPEITLVPVNTDVELTVELSNPDVEVKWLKKGKEIKPSSKYIITSDGAIKKLIIKNASPEDQSEYTCVAANVKTSTKLKVEIIEIAPKITLDKREYKVKRGEDVTIDVKFTSTPPPKEEWSVNGTVIKKSKRVSPTITECSASLTITKVEEKDVGEYQIVLVNSVGEASENIKLTIMEVPGAPGTPDVIDTTDTSVVLHWKKPEFDGNSPITNYILEYHDKEEFLTWHEIKETITETTHTVTGLTTNTLLMFKVSAVNEIGKGPCSDPTTYHKIAKPTGSEPPVIKDPLKDIVAALNESVTLETVISGQPVPEIKWLRDGKPVKSKTMVYENHVAKYTITEVKESSEATYTCKASNAAGTAETSCKLVVQEKPRIEVEPGTDNQSLRVLDQWKVIIKFFGHPSPEITWKKNKELITSEKHCTYYIDESSSTIAIYNVERRDTGTYTITATNSAGTASADLVLRVLDKPTRPEGPILIKDMDKESVTIEWKPPADNGGLELIGYSIEKCDVSKMLWIKVADVDKDILSYTIQRLQEDNEYMFRVYAQNPIGISEALESEVVTVKCKYEKPSPPQGPLEISGMTQTSCTIKWHPPLSDGGTPIIDYTVEQKESTKKAWQKVGTTKDLHICISNMKPETAYEFKITAHNRIGASPPYYTEEPVIAGKRITPPSAPTDFTVKDITSKSVTLNWGPPMSTGGTELTGYIIEKQLATSSKWIKVATLDANIMQYTVENLKEKSEFFFRIYAENSMGLSTPACTGLVSLQTHATVPSPPTAPLETHVISANSISIGWGVPETDGGAPLEGYKIAIRDVKKTMWMEVGQVKADVQKLTIKDLQEGHEYLIRIFARNEVGLSDPLESDEPFLVVRPSGVEEDADVEELALGKDTPSLSFSTETTTSWMREAGMDADIQSYARGSLLRRSEYFFRIWYYARHLFK